ncbi:hypothetical protein BD779DRAFT_1092948 [Infundibulicybe gibba]|nr:hypothetical protein BD779DRAFT_1092948 [Infundibulicybe gibba]
MHNLEFTLEELADNFDSSKSGFLSAMQGDAQGLPSLMSQTPGSDNNDDLDIFASDDAILKEMNCEIDFILDEVRINTACGRATRTACVFRSSIMAPPCASRARRQWSAVLSARPGTPLPRLRRRPGSAQCVRMRGRAGRY